MRKQYFKDHYFRIPGLFQDLCLLPGLSRPENLNILISELSRVCTNPGWRAGYIPRWFTHQKTVTHEADLGVLETQLSK